MGEAFTDHTRQSTVQTGQLYGEGRRDVECRTVPRSNNRPTEGTGANLDDRLFDRATPGSTRLDTVLGLVSG